MYPGRFRQALGFFRIMGKMQKQFECRFFFEFFDGLIVPVRHKTFDDLLGFGFLNFSLILDQYSGEYHAGRLPSVLRPLGNVLPAMRIRM